MKVHVDSAAAIAVAAISSSSSKVSSLTLAKADGTVIETKEGVSTSGELLSYSVTEAGDYYLFVAEGQTTNIFGATITPEVVDA